MVEYIKLESFKVNVIIQITIMRYTLVSRNKLKMVKRVSIFSKMKNSRKSIYNFH